MPRAYKLYLQDILNAALFIEDQIQGLSYEEFVADELCSSAILFKLTVIGEAIKHIPAEIRERHPEVPWREIAGTRDVIVHGYFALNLALIWQAASEEVKVLRQQIEAILQDFDNQTSDRSDTIL